MLSEQDEYKALASVLQGNESEDFEFELQEVQLQPLPECGISSTFLISSFSCAQS
jgi:hypothetical protein